VHVYESCATAIYTHTSRKRDCKLKQIFVFLINVLTETFLLNLFVCFRKRIEERISSMGSRTKKGWVHNTQRDYYHFSIRTKASSFTHLFDNKVIITFHLVFFLLAPTTFSCADATEFASMPPMPHIETRGVFRCKERCIVLYLSPFSEFLFFVYYYYIPYPWVHTDNYTSPSPSPSLSPSLSPSALADSPAYPHSVFTTRLGSPSVEHATTGRFRHLC